MNSQEEKGWIQLSAVANPCSPMNPRRLLGLWVFLLRVVPAIYEQIQVFPMEGEEASI